MATKTGFLAVFVFVTLIVASLANGMLNKYYVPPEPSAPSIGQTSQAPFLDKNYGQTQPAQNNGNAQLQPQIPSDKRVVKLGYSNYAFFFPESGSDTIKLKAGQPVNIEGILEGPERLVGCMKSIRTPWGTKVFKPGDSSFEFTPVEEGKVTFTCGMGMDVGFFEIVN